MNIEEIKRKLKGLTPYLTEQFKVKRIGIFGSYAKGKEGRGSDIDVLVEFSETPDMFEFLKLEEVLKNSLGIKVDLVTPNALKPLIKEEILKETIYI